MQALHHAVQNCCCSCNETNQCLTKDKAEGTLQTEEYIMAVVCPGEKYLDMLSKLY